MSNTIKLTAAFNPSFTILLLSAIFSPPCLAQSDALVICIQRLVKTGVTPDSAAQICQNQSLSPEVEACIIDKMKDETITYTGKPLGNGKFRIGRLTSPEEGDWWRNNGSCIPDQGSESLKPEFGSSDFFTGKESFYYGICENEEMKIRYLGLNRSKAVKKCTGFDSDRPSPKPLPTQSPQPVYPYPVPVYPYSGQGSNPKAVTQCMGNLMYQTEVQKPFPGWICVANDVNCKTVRVRTEVSESSAAVACQNAR